MSGESQGQLLVVEYSAKLRVQNHHWGNAISDLVICGARHSGKSTQRIEPEIRMPGIVQQLSESSKSNCSLFWTKIRVDVEILIIFQLDSEHISLWFDDHKKSSRWERLESAASSSCQLQAWRWETQAKDVWLIFFFSVGQLLTTSELLNLQFVDSVFLWCFIPWKRCCDWPMAWNSRGDQKSHLTSKVWRVLLAMSPLAPLMAAAPAGSRFSSGFTQLVNELRQAGPKRLMVITDFDQTLLGQKGEHLLLLGYT